MDGNPIPRIPVDPALQLNLKPTFTLPLASCEMNSVWIDRSTRCGYPIKTLESTQITNFNTAKLYKRKR
jgi:hypothetical protein